jgi:hypothetical protein
MNKTRRFRARLPYISDSTRDRAIRLSLVVVVVANTLNAVVTIWRQ